MPSWLCDNIQALISPTPGHTLVPPPLNWSYFCTSKWLHEHWWKLGQPLWLQLIRMYPLRVHISGYGLPGCNVKTTPRYYSRITLYYSLLWPLDIIDFCHAWTTCAWLNAVSRHLDIWIILSNPLAYTMPSRPLDILKVVFTTWEGCTLRSWNALFICNQPISTALWLLGPDKLYWE